MKKVVILLVSIILFNCELNAQLQATLYGMTNIGGFSNSGVIFSTPTGSTTTIANYSFPYADGGTPYYTHLYKANNGKYYGVTNLQGSNYYGVFFEYDYPTNYYKKIIDFNGVINGKDPMGSVMQASNGKIYGTTRAGGTFSAGTIFEYDINTTTLTKVFDFNMTSTGSFPTGNLIESVNGKLYGIAAWNGSNSSGTIFEYNTSNNTFTKKIDLTSWSGSQPAGSLIEANNGLMYFLATFGGTNNIGAVVEYNPTLNILTKKSDLTTTSGNKPFGSFIQASNGKLYGLTSEGGTNNFGTIIEYDFNTNTLTKIFDFDGTNTGGAPKGSLIQLSNGKLYGMTYMGGSNNFGTIFSYDYNSSTFTKLFDFNSSIGSGKNPNGSLTADQSGYLLGLTGYGGLTNDGVLFDFNINTLTYRKKFDFMNKYNGFNCGGSLISYTNNVIIGQAIGGGNYNKGTLFEFDANNNLFTKKVDFDGINNGQGPRGALVSYSNGLYYGVTELGGTYSVGTIFSYSASSGTLIKKIDFDGTLIGKNPNSTMVQGNNGLLYGVTASGGNNNDGVIYEYNPNTNMVVKKLDFQSSTTGQYPQARMCLASNGKLYGTTLSGGAFNSGVLFEYNYGLNTYTPLVSFNGTLTGYGPMGELIEAPNGKLYGLTYNGGVNYGGVIFEYDFNSNTYTKKIDFINSIPNPWNPQGAGFRLGSNGKLYATTSIGGTSGFGTVIEYDYINNIMVKKSDFIGTNGNYPMQRGNLLELNICPQLTATMTLNGNVACNSIPTGSATINAYGGSNLTYSWIPSGNTNSLATNLTAGNHTCIVINGCSNSITKTITITQPPSITLIASSNTNIICPNTQVVLSSTASGGTGILSYSWSTGQNIATISATPNVNTIYTVTVKDLNNCLKTGTVFVQTYPSQSLSLNSGTICQGDPFTLIASGNSVSYTYCCGGPIVYPSSTTIYTVEGTDVNGCIAKATNNVTIFALPNVNVNFNKSILCLGETVTVTASGAQTYTWSNSSIGSQIIVAPPLGTTTYSAWGKGNNGCVGVGSNFIYVSSCTNINENIFDKDLIVFPNPAKNALYIKFNTRIDYPINCYVYDLKGKLVIDQKINKEDDYINLSNLNKGLYIVRFVNESDVFLKRKFIKE
ncbi:MAG: T9SS type A sorting domain-containing protein [Bacteroidia bacterium]|nr:T9SS type A sorting domain-containing protein [Bacteroidia bacterium]